VDLPTWPRGPSSGGGQPFTPVGCSLVKTETQIVATGAGTLVTWDSAAGPRCFNEGGCWSEANKARLVAPADGLYFVEATVWFDAEGTNKSLGERALHLTLEGNSKRKFFGINHCLNATNGRILSCSGTVRLLAGEWVAFEVFQDSTENRKLEKEQWDAGFPSARVLFERIR
jgi:hypothetical protein